MNQPTEYELRLRAAPGHPWRPDERIKRLLKFAGRSLGLRVTALREVKQQKGNSSVEHQ